MASATLQAIETKVRRLTRSPSESQLSTLELDNYINTAILYDFPSHLRLFSLRKTLTFYTQPFQDVYYTNPTDQDDPLYNFQNINIAVHQPIFIAGLQSFYTQYRDVFFGMWPKVATVAQTGLFGNGTVGPFIGTLNSQQPVPNTVIYPSAVLQNNVVFSALDVNGQSMILIDYPAQNIQTVGILALPGQNTQTNPIDPLGSINYETGAFSFEFPAPTTTSFNNQPNPVNSSAVYYQPGKPISMLYYDNKFTLRPVPDNVYTVQIEVDVRPTQLLLETDIPQLEQWWQFIAYMAARKIFQDRMDLDSVALMEPEYRIQMNMVARTSIEQYANMRSKTIYTEGKNYGFGWFGNSWPY